MAYTEFVFDDVGRNLTLAEINAKRAMAHVQTAFCHPSLGMKVHINVQDVIFLEGVTTPYIKHRTPSMGDLTESLNDEDTHIILYVMEGFAGEAHAESPCQGPIAVPYTFIKFPIGALCLPL